MQLARLLPIFFTKSISISQAGERVGTSIRVEEDDLIAEPGIDYVACVWSY